MSGVTVKTKSLPDQSCKRVKDDFIETSELVAEFAGKEGRQPRIMILKMGNDGRDKGGKQISSGFADLGFDVDLAPVFRKPAEAAKQAVENDVHVISICSVADGFENFIPNIIRELKKLDRNDIQVIVEGTVTSQHYKILYDAGVAAIFNPEIIVASEAKEIMKILLADQIRMIC